MNGTERFCIKDRNGTAYIKNGTFLLGSDRNGQHYFGRLQATRDVSERLQIMLGGPTSWSPGVKFSASDLTQDFCQLYPSLDTNTMELDQKEGC